MAERERNSTLAQIAVIALVALTYVVVGVYCRVVARTEMLFADMAYVAIVLAGLWFGRRALYLAGLLAIFTFLLHAAGTGPEHVLSATERAVFFMGVAFCVGTLSKRSAAMEEAMSAPTEGFNDKSSPGMLIFREGKVLMVNDRFAEMLGYEKSDMIGRPSWSFCHDQEQAKVRGFVGLREEGAGVDLHYECRLVRQDESIIWADVASSPVNYEDAPAVCVTAYNITDQKEAEEKTRELSELAKRQEEQLIHSTRLAELGEMAASIAHELNQPLTGIRNFAKNAIYMLEEDAGSPEEATENLRLITEQVDRAAKIISQMRQLARRAERQFASLDVNAIVSDTVDFLTPQLRLADVEVSISTAANLPEVMGDRVRLEQVFLNLLTNAKQAMASSDERRLAVKTYTEHSNYPVVVEIRDTGKGFAPEETSKLFAPFFSTKQPGQGTGLGLSISLSIIKDHHGTIEATGRPGRGAAFKVKLPVQLDEQAWERPEVHE